MGVIGAAGERRGIAVKTRLIIEWICRLFIGGIFIYAGVTKIFDPCRFAQDIYNYHLIPGALVNLSAILLPYIEVVFGVCLIFGVAARGASLGIVLVLAFFLVILSINFVRGISFDCGCFGSGQADLCKRFVDAYVAAHPGVEGTFRSRLQSGCDIVRDILLLIPALTAFVLLQKKPR